MKKFLILVTILLFVLSSNAQKLGILFTTADGLPSDSIYTIEKDINGNLWIGTHVGLSKYDGANFINYTITNGLPSNRIYSLDSDNNGNIYIGTSSGAAKFDGITFTQYDSISGIVYSIIIDQQNRVWSSSGNNGIFRFDGVNWEHYTISDGLSNNTIHKLFEDNSGFIYAGGKGTCVLNKFNASAWLNFETDTACIYASYPTFINGIYQDNYGDIWVAGQNLYNPYPTTINYFAKFNGSQFTVYEINQALNNSTKSTSFYLNNDKIYFGTEGRGFSQFDFQANTYATYDDNNLFYDKIYYLLPDGNNLWVGTDQGLVLINDFDQLVMHPYSESLDTNNFSVIFHSMGDMFWDLSGQARVEIPKGSGKTSLFVGGLWVGAYDQLNNFHGASNTFYPNTEFWAGPIADNYDIPFLSKYNRLWKINKNEIDYHIQNYNNGSYQMPDAIENWPGNGNTSNGEAEQLAPYYDHNQNGIYEPHFGDYPLIRGDQAVYFIYNDARLDTHSTSHCEPMGIEVHAMAYAYDNLSESLDNTFFINFKIINRLANDYHDLYIGQFNEFDLGDSFDDFTGCDSTQNTFYVYNGDEFDGDGYGHTYGLNPPAQGITFLNYPMTSYMYFNNGSCDMCYPEQCNEFYNYLQAIWKDDVHLTFGSTGHNNSSVSHYYFPFGSGWSEESENNTPYDRRGVGASGPFILSSGNYICLDLAYPWARDTSGAYSSLLKLLNNSVPNVQSFYISQNYPCYLGSQLEELSEIVETIDIFPNPTTGGLFVNSKTSLINNITIYDLWGREVMEVDIQNHNSRIDLSKQAKGMYFIKMTTNNYTEIRKIIKN